MKKIPLFCIIFLLLLVGCARSQIDFIENENTSSIPSSSGSALQTISRTLEATTPTPISTSNAVLSPTPVSSSIPSPSPAPVYGKKVNPNTSIPSPSPAPVYGKKVNPNTSIPSPSPAPVYGKKVNPNTDENAYPKVTSSINRVPADNGSIYFKNSMLTGQIRVYFADGSGMQYDIEATQGEEFLLALQLEQFILSEPINSLSMYDMSCGNFVRISGDDMNMIAVYEDHSQALYVDKNGETVYYNAPEGTYELIYQIALEYPDKKNVR